MNEIKKREPATFFHIGIVLVTLLLFAGVQNLPLLGTLGFESANLFVALLGPWFFLSASLTIKARYKGYGSMLNKELLWFLVHMMVFGIPLFANGFLRQSCSEGRGLIPFLVIAVPPLLL